MDAEERLMNAESELQRALERVANLERALTRQDGQLADSATADTNATATASEGGIIQDTDVERARDTKSEGK